MALQTHWDIERDIAPENLKETVELMRQLCLVDGMANHIKISGALQVLIAFTPMSPQYEKMLEKLEDKLDQFFDVPGEKSLTQLNDLFDMLLLHTTPLCSNMRDLTHNMLLNTLLPICEGLPVCESEMGEVMIGMVAVLQPLQFARDMRHALKALEYDASLYALFPSDNTKEALVSQVSEMINDYF